MTKRPSQFDDPAIDALLSIVLALGGEVYVLRDRLRIVEKMLDEKGSLNRADIESYKPSSEEEAELRKDRDEFMKRLFRVFANLGE